MRTCRTCKHWQFEDHLPESGRSIVNADRQCKRFPPSVFWDGDETRNDWPWLNHADFCGEWDGTEISLQRPMPHITDS